MNFYNLFWINKANKAKKDNDYLIKPFCTKCRLFILSGFAAAAQLIGWQIQLFTEFAADKVLL